MSPFARAHAAKEREPGGKGLETISSSTEEMAVLFDLAQGISGCIPR